METKERPIIFSTEMVKAILDDRKTQTRRVIKPQPIARAINTDLDTLWEWKYDCNWWYKNSPDESGILDYCPYGQVGDRFYVKETHHFSCDAFAVTTQVNYKDGTHKSIDPLLIPEGTKVWNSHHRYYPQDVKWRPSIFMHRWASRITREITDIRVERLQNISREDITAEGCPWQRGDGPWDDVDNARRWFSDLWDSINGKKYPWDSNPWVWVISFKKEVG